MLRRLIILDIALFALLFFGALKVRQTWNSFWPAHQVASIRPAAEPLATLPAPVARPPANENWTEIPTRNPFSFDRNDIDVMSPVAAAAAKVSGPKPLLFGVMFLDSQRLAMLGPGQPGSRSFRPMKVGESIDGWNIVSIDAKTATVESNGVQQILIMNDPAAQIPREISRTAGQGAAPASSSVAAPPPPAQQTMAPAQANPAPNAPPGMKARTVVTPFGKVTLFDPIP